MKRLIVIFLILLLVAGGGAGALIMLGIVPNPFGAPKPATMTASDKAASAEDHKRFQPPLSAPALVKFEDLIVPVIINGQVTRRVYITARIVATRRDLTDAVEAKTTAYRDAVIADLVPFFQNYYLDHDTLDLNVIKERLTKDAHTLYGDNVSDVLLINVFDQSLGRVNNAR